MTSTNSSATYSQSRTDTLIGAGLRVEGAITFSGVLRILGDVRGDVTCADDAAGSAIVGKSGQVDGAINAPHIVVGGRVDGPLQASESIEIQRGACVVGDACFKEIAIHAGGLIEGVLTPGNFAERTESVVEPHAPILEQPAAAENVISPVNSAIEPMPADSRIGDRFGNWRKSVVVVLLLIAVGTVVLMNRDSLPVAATVAEPVPAVIAPPQEVAAPVSAAQPAPAASVAVVNSPLTVTETVAPVVPSAIVETKKVVKAAAPAVAPVAVSEKVVLVQGDNPDKSASAVFLVIQEPAVLFKKGVSESGEGKRIELSQRGNKTLSIATDEILRVGEGSDINIFYQGRKVAPNTISSGAWIRFVPRSASGSGETPR